MAAEHTAEAEETLRRGDYYEWIESFYEDDGETPLEGLDFTESGWEFLMQVRATADAADVMATWTVTVESAYQLRRVLSNEQSALLEPTTAVQDLQGINPDGQKRTYVTWELEIQPDVSRP